MAFTMLRCYLSMSPFMAMAVLFESHGDLSVGQSAPHGEKSPCDGLRRKDCTAHRACAWSDSSCDVRIAWLHIMKCGSSFETTIVHFANGSIPDKVPVRSGMSPDDLQEPSFFRFKYPVGKWFKNVFRHPGNPVSHLPIMQDEWSDWRGNWFGIFRSPARRALSSYYDYAGGRGDLIQWAKKVEGQQASMLSMGKQGIYKVKCELNGLGAMADCIKMVKPNVPLAIRRLDNFAFVGIHEEFKLSVCLFHKMFGSECLPVEFNNSNPGAYTANKSALKEQLGLLELRADQFDDPVYKAATRRFWSDVRRYNLKPSTCRKLCPSQASFQDKSHQEDAFLIPTYEH
eukprot:TRINITY_DN73793_c0_g1_i1.p1 TRINITY_DN73793_c0_g1~~TRINITY_DN73793_c0_g1_i1.p1  ORF type:complete len:364 (-),score=40.85 TRINITY_DN73793_c0_g1_i1:27-1055(-)